MDDDLKTVIFDNSLAADARLLYLVFRAVADEKGRVQMGLPEIAEYAHCSTMHVSRRILPELVQHGLISRDSRTHPYTTQLL